MAGRNEEWRNEGTPEGCKYFLLTFLGFGLIGLGVWGGIIMFIISLITQSGPGTMDFGILKLIGGVFLLVCILLGVFVFYLRNKIKPPAE